jgi:DNA-binding SARP family transcriptional activator/tetratricopeptide (TPR) repeat protein
MAEFQLLGPVQAHAAGRALELGPPKQRTLLAALLLDAGRPVLPGTLVHRVWGDSPPAEARNALYGHIMRIRRVLAQAAPEDGPAPRLEHRDGGYRLDVDPDRVDLHRFRRLVRQAGDSGHSDADRASLLRAALELWRGAPLAGLSGPWIERVRDGCHQQRLDALVGWGRVELRLGNHETLLGQLPDLVAEYPLAEPLTAVLMRALHAAGRPAEALARYSTTRERLADELGADPGVELRDLHLAMLRGDIEPSPTPVAPRRARPADEGSAVTAAAHVGPPPGAAHLGPAPPPAHRQLPPDIADFTGREAELRALHRMLPDRDGANTAVVISAIEGMGGVGKTRLAVHLAHQLVRSGRYAEIQLYVDLRGHAAEPPADPATVLASFLRLLGVSAAQIPGDLDGRAALYRDRLDGRHALVLLDNAGSEDQVLPLLPAAPTSLVLVTGRRTLAIDGARALALDVLPPHEADALLVRVAGRSPAATDPVAVRRITDLCGRLPLALVLSGRRLQSRPAWSFADLAARLRREGNRLAELAVGTRQVRAVFDLSYRALDPPAQRLFRLVGLHPGDDFTAESAAALAGLPPAAARRMLDRLVDEHLVTQVTADRYRLHDLLREYAAERVAEQDGEEAARHALGRVLNWYLYAAHGAVRVLFPHNADVAPDDGQRPADQPAFDDDQQAFGWLNAERPNLLAAVSAALRQGFHTIAWQLPIVLRQYLDRRGDRDDLMNINLVAVAAAGLAGDCAAEALTLSVLGTCYARAGRFDQSVQSLKRALQIRRDIGDREGVGRTLNNLGTTYGRQGRLDDAIRYLREGLAIHREIGAGYRESRTLNNLGEAYARAGQHGEAVHCLRQALEYRRRLGDPVGVAAVLLNLGSALRKHGQHREAIAHLTQALEISQEKHCRKAQADTLLELGEALLVAGEPVLAGQRWQQAAIIFSEFSPRQAEELRERVTLAAGHP